MKANSNVLLCVVVLCLVCTVAQAQCKVEEVDYRGWNALKMSNALVELYVVPDIGGRVIQFIFDGHEYLFVNDSLTGKVLPYKEGEWNNYGGDKLWPAPQGWDGPHQWPGPGDPVLDSGRFTFEILQPEGKRASVRLTSPPDKERSGIQFSRIIALKSGEPKVFFENTMTNVSDHTVSWGVWSVTQIDAANPDGEGYNDQLDFYCALNPRSIYPKKYCVLYGLVNNFAWLPDYKRNLFRGHYNYLVGKVGVDSPGGWLASVDSKTGYVLVQRFSYFRGRKYPDDSSVEFWINGAGSFIAAKTLTESQPDPEKTPYLFEMEILSPLVTLRPRESYTFETEWKAVKGAFPELMKEVGIRGKP